MTPEPEQPREKRHKLIEDIFILLCIASLWPVVARLDRADLSVLALRSTGGPDFHFRAAHPPLPRRPQRPARIPRTARR